MVSVCVLGGSKFRIGETMQNWPWFRHIASLLDIINSFCSLPLVPILWFDTHVNTYTHSHRSISRQRSITIICFCPSPVMRARLLGDVGVCVFVSVCSRGKKWGRLDPFTRTQKPAEVCHVSLRGTCEHIYSTPAPLNAKNEMYIISVDAYLNIMYVILCTALCAAAAAPSSHRHNYNSHCIGDDTLTPPPSELLSHSHCVFVRRQRVLLYTVRFLT